MSLYDHIAAPKLFSHKKARGKRENPCKPDDYEIEALVRGEINDMNNVDLIEYIDSYLNERIPTHE